MKKFKKIICLALAMVMMMVMSVTAFAAEATDKLEEVATKTTQSVIKVTNISTRETSEVTIYQVAKVDFEKNTVTVNDWAKGVYNDKTTDFTALEEAAANTQKYDSATPVDGATEFTVDAGVYLVTINSTLVKYSPMVARAYGVTKDGVYSGVPTYTLVAKGSTSTTEKTTDDANKFVKAGTVVPFTIKTNVPYEATSFVVVDQPTNLTLSDATVTVKGVEGSKVFKWTAGTDEDKNEIQSIDLSEYLTYKNAEVTITYTGTVGKAIESAENGYSYINSAYTNINGEETTPTPPVKGYTGTIIVNKTTSDNKPLEGATFNVKDSNGNVVKFETNDKGEYVYSEKADAKADVVTNKDGKITVTGLATGEYKVVETKAPAGYSVDPTEYKLTITNTASENKNCVVSQNVIDPDLVRLPFTGGMGTTIFTVLGVAIMVIAAALYFASKKSAKN